MRRTTVTLPDSLHYRLGKVASQRRTTVTKVVRDALQKELDNEQSDLSFVNSGKSGLGDLACNADDYRDRGRSDYLKRGKP